MLSSLSRSIHKTPLVNYKSNCYEDMDSNEFLQQVCQSKLISEGVFGIEQFIMNNYSEEIMFTPHICKLNHPIEEKDWNGLKDDLKHSNCYEISLNNLIFFPLDTKTPVNLLNKLKELSVGTLFVQVLFCKRVDNWREVAISQYEEYLSGNDTPSPYKVVRSLQSKVIQSLRRFEVKRSPIEEIAQKILSQGYRFEMRIVLLEKKHKNKFENEVNSLLKQMSYYNELELTENKYKKDLLTHILERRFQVNLNSQLLSETEMFSLLTDMKTTVKPQSILPPVKQQSITKTMEESMLLQNAIKLMPYKEKLNKDVDKSAADKVNQAFKRVGIVQKPLKVTEIHQGATLLKVQMVVPPEIMYTSFTKKLKDIHGALGNENVSIEIGDKPDTINVFVPLEERGIVYFRSLLESDEFQEFKKNHPLPFIIGENTNGGNMFHDLSELRHLLITGATGSGKSVFVNLLLLSLILCVPVEELILYLIDPKEVEYTLFKGFPQVKDIVTDMKKANSLVASLVAEMDRRYSQFAKIGVKNIVSYNNKSDEKIPYIVVAIDEYADLVMVNPNVEEHLVRLGQKARAAGIHMIICTQKPLADIVTSVLKSNLPSAFSFRLKTSTDYVTVFGKGIPYNLLGRGDGVAKLEGQMKEYERFQSPLLTLDENEEEELYAKLKDLFKDVQLQFDSLPEVVEESQIDKLKRIIASTNELRVSELGRLMGIGNNSVADLIKQLVEDEWLVKPGRSYEINVSEEELAKWRDKDD